MEQYSIFEIASYFLSKESMTHKKLQKLCYYAEAWCYALLDYKLTTDTHFVAWVHGPVSPTLYAKFRGYGWLDIPKNNSIMVFDDKVTNLLEDVWFTYGELTGNALEVLSHSEDPWRNSRKGLREDESSNRKINPEIMKSYYKSIYIGI